MPTKREFRARFKEYIGTEKYARFVTCLHRLPDNRSELRFWQQELWQLFVRDHPNYDLSAEELVDALRICEIHEVELYAKEIPVCHGDLYYDREYERDRVLRFPHATLEEIMVGPDYTRPTCTLWVCPTCDQILNASRWRRR